MSLEYEKSNLKKILYFDGLSRVPFDISTMASVAKPREQRFRQKLMIEEIKLR